MGTGADVELGAMERTGQEGSTQAPFRQLGITMRAVVGHGMELAGDAAHDDTVFAEFGEHPELPVPQFAQIAEFAVVS